NSFVNLVIISTLSSGDPVDKPFVVTVAEDCGTAEIQTGTTPHAFAIACSGERIVRSPVDRNGTISDTLENSFDLLFRFCIHHVGSSICGGRMQCALTAGAIADAITPAWARSLADRR